MKTVYISGPISKVINGNIAAFREAQSKLESLGFEVLNPHEICSEINPRNYETLQEYWEACMRACIKSMMDAELIVLLPGFTDSKGAMVEWELAKQLNIPITTIEKIKQ